MGRISNIVIAIANGRDTFQPGKFVEGNVLIKITKAVKICKIIIRMVGKCKTKWKTGSGDNEKSYKGKELYCNLDTVLWGSDQQETQMAAGDFSKPFRFRLPRDCPSTFSTKHGDVWYVLEVVCTFPGIMSVDQEHTLPIRVYDNVNLSADPQTAELVCRPLQIKDEQKEDSCCCSDVSVTTDVTLDKSAYAPGDTIILNGYIENGCSSPMPYTIVLKQQVICYGTRSDFSFTSSGNLKSKEKTEEVVSWKGQKIPTRSRKVFQNEETMKIPDIVASDLRNCRLITVGYYLKIKGIMPGSCCDLTFELKKVPIVIGGRPRFQGPNSSVPPTAPPLDLPSYNTLEPSAPTPGDIVEVKINDTEPPPPSYEDSVGNVAYTAPSQQEITRDNVPSQTTYYDWSQSAFTYN
uniref:Arrestin domain-containing protein 3-like n=1 Tax=Phallusia mammillata TaxID=59560 RepID=A0A6F9D7E2_9ASCI|nr:arrestin domain-containing protein 3-like [Phallusia mammillata]